ncbi:MAG: inositol monophosphatase family protein [Actinomycetes bacterium]
MLEQHDDWADWIAACRRMVKAIEGVLARHPTTADRDVVVGLGEGGDRTLVIDAMAEDAVFAELGPLSDACGGFTAIAEERGEVVFGDGLSARRVIIDPIDGSLNAKRVGGPCALSVAVAEGGTMADVAFGFVHDFHSGEEWIAVAGAGAELDGRPLDREVQPRFRDDGRVEVLGIESADPRWVAAAMDGLLESAYRLRALGAIAVSLCQVAAGRNDAMASLRGCRSIDAAAAQLVVREAGGVVAWPHLDDPGSAPLDLLPHSPIVAGRNAAALEVAARVVGSV